MGIPFSADISRPAVFPTCRFLFQVRYQLASPGIHFGHRDVVITVQPMALRQQLNTAAGRNVSVRIYLNDGAPLTMPAASKPVTPGQRY